MKRNLFWILLLGFIAMFLIVNVIMIGTNEKQNDCKSLSRTTSSRQEYVQPKIEPVSFQSFLVVNIKPDHAKFLQCVQASTNVNESVVLPDSTIQTVNVGIRQIGLTNWLAQSGDYVTPLSIAVQCQIYDAIELLLAKGADPNSTICRAVLDPLHQAITYQDVAVVSNLLEHGADPNRMNVPGNAVSMAVMSWRAKTSVMSHYLNDDIIAGGADFHTQVLSAVGMLARNDFKPNEDLASLRILDMVVTAGGNVDTPNPNGFVPLVSAAIADNFDAFVYLLDKVSSPENCMVRIGDEIDPLYMVLALNGDQHLRYLKAMKAVGVDVFKPFRGISILDIATGSETKKWLNSIKQ